MQASAVKWMQSVGSPRGTVGFRLGPGGLRLSVPSPPGGLPGLDPRRLRLLLQPVRLGLGAVRFLPGLDGLTASLPGGVRQRPGLPCRVLPRVIRLARLLLRPRATWDQLEPRRRTEARRGRHLLGQAPRPHLLGRRLVERGGLERRADRVEHSGRTVAGIPQETYVRTCVRVHR